MSTPLSASVPDAPLVDETVEEGSGKGVVAGLDARADKVRRKVSSRPASIIAIVLAIIFVYMMRHRPFGRQLYAVGGNPEVARLAGYNVKRVKFIGFILSSLLAGVAGILLSSRLGSAVHVSGLGYEFQVVAAVVLGGVSLAGGIGSLFGVVLGVLILSFLSNGLGMLKLPTETQQVITGIIIIGAVGLDELRRRRK